MVYHVLGAISRWTCPLCGSTFTHWPEFALPNKRYVRWDVKGRIRLYVEDEARTYEDAASEGGLAIIHEEGARGLPKQMAPSIPGMRDELLPNGLARSTIWRWVGWLGRMEEALREAMALIAQRDPNDRLHRVTITVRPAKFRTPEREGMIKTAALLLRAWARIRGPPPAPGKITPSNATGGKKAW